MTTAENTFTRQDGFNMLADYFPEETIKPEFEPIAEAPRYRPVRSEIDPDTTKNWFRRVLPVLLTHKYLIIISLSMSFLSMIINIAVPALVGKAIDTGLVEKTRSIIPYVILLIGLGISHGILLYVSRYTHSKLTYSLDYDLRTLAYNHLTKLSFSFYDRMQSGQLISRANSDIQAIERFLTAAPNIFQTILTFVSAISYMVTMHVTLTIVTMLTLPGVYMLSSRMRRVMFPLSWLMQARTAEVTTIADENINGVRVVKSFAAEERQIKLLAMAAERLRWSRVETVKLRARFMPLIGALPQVGTALILLYGGFLIIEGELTIGMLVAFNSYVMMVTMPFRTFANFLMQYERARASAQRIYEVLDEKSEIVESQDATDLVNAKGKIEFQNVTFGYNKDSTILKGFDLKIQPGEAVAIVGRTGSGKTTITRLLTRFYDVNEGAVCIDGHDIRDLTLVSLRASIGTVLDEPFLFSTSIRENIAYGRPNASLEDIILAAKAASAHEFICDLPDGYDTIIGERGYTLSGGQRQRIAIARTLLVNPRILVLDDATSSVDVQVEAEIHNTLKTLMKDRTTIVIAHRLSTILLAERVVLIEGGKIIASGTHAELMWSEPRYVEVLARAEEEKTITSEDIIQEMPEIKTSLKSLKIESSIDLIPVEPNNLNAGDDYGGSS